MMYHPINCGCKKVGGSLDVVETVLPDYKSLHCDPDLEESKPIFLHDTLAHDDSSAFQVWLKKKKVQQSGRYRQDEHILEF